MKKISLLIATACVCLSTTVDSQAAAKTIRLLTIGNSFAENALIYLPQIVEASGKKLIVGRANLGGCTLERHWKHVAQHEADPDGKGGSPYRGGKYSLKDMLTKDKWDFITIQQVSYKSHDPKTYQPFADNLHAYIKKHAPAAKIVAHQIWAYRIDDPRFKPANKGREPHTHRVIYEQVRQAYHSLAKKLDLGILPSGDAMFLADIDKEWGYQVDKGFDFENATYPSRPSQTYSLHTGWFWKKEKGGSALLDSLNWHSNIGPLF